jgi:hypothetical protein
MKKNGMPVFRFPKCPLKFLKLWNITCGDTRIFCPVLLECSKAKFVVYVEGTLCPSISFLEIRRDIIMPTP